MFERFGDLPLHVLVIHAAVVLIPGAALLAIAYAVRPQWRWLLRWPLLLGSLGALAVAYVAKESGEAFVAAVPDLEQLVREHKDRGTLLLYFTIGFAAICVLAFLWLGGPSPLTSGRGAKKSQAKPVDLAVSAAVVVMSLIVIVWTIRTGDSGAKAVWDGQLPEG
jgi:bacteriorhodopsin